MPENAEIKQQQKNNITDLVIATRIKEELTPNKSEIQSKNYYQKQKQTTAQKNCKQVRNLRMQHRSKPGQRRQQHFWGHVTADQFFFKIKNLKFGWRTPGYVGGSAHFSSDFTEPDHPQNRTKVFEFINLRAVKYLK